MYREPASPSSETPPAEFLYAVADRDRRRGTALAALQLFTFPVAAAAFVAALTTPTAGAVTLVLAGWFVVRWWRRGAAGGAGILLRLSGDELTVFGASRKLRARLRLADLIDVTLDTKTIQPTMEGDSPIPGLRLMMSQPLPEVDQQRIVLTAKSGDLPLTDAYLPSVDVTEWFGKIRVFLRRHGWAPLAEREEAREDAEEPEQR